MRIFLIIVLLFMPVLSYAETKTITKSATVVVPTNQSVEQVKQYTSEQLFREAAEEAGVAVYSSTSLVDGKISKDEIKMQTSAIAQKDVKILSQEIINGQTYITVQVKATVDSKELDAFLRQLMQNEALKQELNQERKEKLELEKKLKKASKEEYDNTLSLQAANIAKAQAARQKQLEKEISNAKEQLLETQKRQKAEELQAAKELEQIQKEYTAQNAALQARILAEKDAQAKAEMEHQALLAELAQNALINDKTMDMSVSDTVELISMDAAQVRVRFSSIVNEYKTAMSAGSKKMAMYHKSQLEILEKQKFTEELPKRDEWDNTATYNKKKNAYSERKADFEDKKRRDIENLKNEYKEKTAKNEKNTKTSLLRALKPFYERLKKYNDGMYIASDMEKAVIDFGKRNIDNLTLPIIVKYKNKKYNFIYSFNSLQQFRAMYDTRASFKAVPIYAIEPNGAKGAKPYLKGFRVVHLGNNREEFFPVKTKHSVFPEILQYEKMAEELNPNNKNMQVTEQKTANYGDYSYQNGYKHHTSDTVKKSDTYKAGYWLLGVQAGLGFDLDTMNAEVSVQNHWRFNRWFGIYINGSLLVGFNGLKSSNNYDDDDDDDYYSKHSHEDIIDTGLAIGLGLDIYLSNSILLFGEANAAYFIESNGESGFGGIFRGGLAFQSKNIQRTGMRLNIFVEGIVSDTISGSTPYFGVGIYF